MRNLKYLFLLFAFSSFLFTSCVDQETDYEANGEGPNLVTFSDTRTSITKVADGSEQDFKLKVKLVGPSYMDVKENITYTVSVDPSSTAIANVHYKIAKSTEELLAANNHFGLFTFTMLTAGIETPLAKAPVLVLKVSQADGNGNVIASGKTIAITLNYACPSELAGDYNVTVVRTASSGAVTNFNFTETIYKTGVGTYRTTEVGHWIGGLGVGTPGYTFTDVCGVINVPEQNLLEYYSNIVRGLELGTVAADGTIHIVYEISFAAGPSSYDATYVPVKK